MSLHFVQWTLAIQSEQSFAVYDKAKRQLEPRLVAGDPSKIVKVGGGWRLCKWVFAVLIPVSTATISPCTQQVVDYWVFERPVLKSWFVPKPGPKRADWRLVARLQQPEGRPPQLPPVPV